MKKAKIILTCVAVLAVVGGALAFKARYEPANIWYIPAAHPVTTTTTLAGGFVYSTTIPNCTLSNQVTTDIGNNINTSSSTTRANVTTIFTRLVSPGVTSSFTTTYHFCTLFVTKTALADS